MSHQIIFQRDLPAPVEAVWAIISDHFRDYL